MAFNPDAYLQAKTTNTPPANSGFNPDAYLQSKTQNIQAAPQSTPAPGSMADLVNQRLAQKGMTLSQGFHQIANQPLATTAKQALEYIPHGVGLAARNISEGVGNTVDFLTTPLRYIIQATTGKDVSGGGQALANALNLPTAQNPTEKVTSEAEKLMAGGGGIVGAAAKVADLAKAGGVTQNILQTIAATPDKQLASMLGSGIAGGWVKEEGGPGWLQLIASLGGGLAAPSALGGAQKGFMLGKSIINNMAKSPNLEVKINTTINAALESQGIPASSISGAVRQQIANDMEGALKNGDMSPDVVRRLVDYHLTGTTPTSGTLTQDPGLLTRQKNLAKIGANSQDPAIQKLSQIQNDNNQQLVQRMNDLGANTSQDTYAAGQKTINALDNLNQGVKSSVIDPLYKQARNTQGRSALLDPAQFTQKANDLLDQNMVGGVLPSDVRNNLNKIATGQTPLTVDVAEQFKTALGRLQRNTPDKSVRLSIGLVRQALDDTPLASGQGQEAVKAFNTARKANAAWMGIVERTPALQAVRDGVEPDKFMQTYVIGNGKDASFNNVQNLSRVIQAQPEAQTAIRNNIAQWLKDKALNNAVDEQGKLFSSSAYNRALKSIGDRKLNLFFNKDEVSMLKAIGRVASYEQSQPVGSAVNNSNTASNVIANTLDWIGNIPLLRKIPFVSNAVSNQSKSIAQNIQAGEALKVPKFIPSKAPTQRPTAINMLSAAILSSENSKKNKR